MDVKVTNEGNPGPLLVQVFQKGTGGAPDTLLSSGILPSANDEITLTIATGDYVQAREPDESEVKSIDNWRP